MLSKNIKYLVGVDHLRALAALLVILYHGTQLIGAQIAHNSAFIPQNDWGYTQWNFIKSFIAEGHFGVALFMTLSGFIFTTGLYKKHINVKGFFRNRFIRIYPLYIFLLIVSFYFYPPIDPLQAMILHILPFANISASLLGTGLIASSAMFWTIAVEVQFYLVFPFLMRWLNEHKFKLLWGIIGLFTTLRLLAFISGDVSMSNFGYFSIFGRIDQFIIGMFAGYIYLKKASLITKNLKLYTALSLGAIIVLLFIMNRLRHHFGFDAFENFYVILPTIEGLCSGALIVSYVLFAKKLTGKISHLFAKVGELSYSLYLTHFILLSLLIEKVDLPNILGNSWWSALFFSIFLLVPASLLFSMLTYYVIEKPFLGLRKKYIAPKKEAEKFQQAI